MKQPWSKSARKKKIKAVLLMMNKQNQWFIPVVPPLVDLMSLVTTDEELDYLLKMGTGSYGFAQAQSASSLSDVQFQSFFDTVKRKGLVHVDLDSVGEEKYRLNAIAVGWYEVMMHYLMGRPEQKKFSEKWHEFFLYFKKFNFTPLRNLQDLFLRNYLKPVQAAAILDPSIEGNSKRKTIPINSKMSYKDSKVYPTFHVNKLVEEYGEQDAIYLFPCVCRQGNSVINSPCRFEVPRDSCVAFGSAAKVWANWGYGRHISKSEARVSS